MPQGLGPASRVFTKILKPVFSHLRGLGIDISGFIDDSILLDDGDSNIFDENVEYSAITIDKLGFTVNVLKSVLPPNCCTQITHLGFDFDSNVTVQCTREKMRQISTLANELINQVNSDSS